MKPQQKESLSRRFDSVGTLQAEERLGDQASRQFFLCLTSTGLWLARFFDERPEGIEAVDPVSLGYSESLRGDRITIASHEYRVPLGRGGAIKEIVAKSRIRSLTTSAPQRERPWKAAVAMVASIPAALEEWLPFELGGDELVLVAQPVRKASDHEGKASEYLDWFYVLTTTRHFLVGSGSLGAIETLPLGPDCLGVTDVIGLDEVTVGSATFGATLRNEDLFRQIAQAPALSEEERLRELAAAGWHQGRTQDTEELLQLLEARGSGDPLDTVTRNLVDELNGSKKLPDSSSSRIAQAILELSEGNVPAERLAHWLKRWRWPEEARVGILEHLLAGASAKQLEWLVELHRAIQELERLETKDPSLAWQRDLRLARHLLDTQHAAAAADVLRSLLAELDREEGGLEDLLSSSAEGASEMRPAALRLLLEALSPDDDDLARLTLQLARCDPFDVNTLRALLESVTGAKAERVERLIAAMGKGGLKGDEPKSIARVGVLSADQLELVMHPSSRSTGMLGTLQKLVAKVKSPSAEALRSHSEQLNSEDESGVVEAIGDGALMLGAPSTPVFVSRGSRDVGIRAYPDDGGFIVVGAQHLDSKSRAWLTEPEIRFAIGAELACLRFGYARLTSQDLWRGAASTIATVASIAPMLGPLAQKAGLSSTVLYRNLRKFVSLDVMKALTGVQDGRKIASVLPGRIANSLQALPSSLGRLGLSTGEGSIEADEQRTLVTLRSIQFTADRVGLLLSGDLVASIRAIFLLDKSYRDELSLAERVGLEEWARARAHESSGRLEQLLTRLAHLCSFYLSDELAELLDA